MSKKSVVGLVLLGLVMLGSFVVASPADFLGSWVNVDPNTGGLTKLIVAQQGGGYTVQGFGKCHPTDCDWGRTTLNLLGYSVTDTNPQWGLAVWNAGFKTTTLVIHVEGEQLVAETYDVFAPGDGRSNYRGLYLLKRS